MKKIITLFAITLVLFACKKSESPLPEDEGSAMELSDLKAMTVITYEATFVTSATATCSGEIQTDGGGGNVIERGVCYKTGPNPKITNFTVPSGSGNGSFTSILSGLSGSTLYYARAYAIKSNGTVKYGNQVSFTTLPDFGTVTDADGNVYTTININNQVWTVENLKTTKYRDGTLIPNVTDSVLWASQTTGAYCNYNNDDANVDTYGRLYNWYAVTDEHNIAPEGWHAPTKDEMLALQEYLGGWNVAGGLLKEAGFEHWSSPNMGADNSSGFSALPGGHRYVDPFTSRTWFSELGHRGEWWLSSVNGPGNPEYIYMQSSTAALMGISAGGGWGNWYWNPKTGYSVRLVKD